MSEQKAWIAPSLTLQANPKPIEGISHDVHRSKITPNKVDVRIGSRGSEEQLRKLGFGGFGEGGLGFDYQIVMNPSKRE